MEHVGGLTRWAVGEVIPPPFDAKIASLTREGNFVYYAPNPAVSYPLAHYFGDPSVLTTNLPADFVSIFGTRAAAGFVKENFWFQQLALWRDAKRPDWVDDAMEANAAAQWALYTSSSADGRGLWPFRLTNGAERVYLPGADKRAGSDEELPIGLCLPAELVYKFVAHGIMLYQTRLLAAGVKPDNLFPWLKNQGFGDAHSAPGGGI